MWSEDGGLGEGKGSGSRQGGDGRRRCEKLNDRYGRWGKGGGGK